MSLARLMGHSTTRTLNRYVSNTLDSHLKAVNLVGDWLKRLTAWQAVRRKVQTPTRGDRTFETVSTVGRLPTGGLARLVIGAPLWRLHGCEHATHKRQRCPTYIC